MANTGDIRNIVIMGHGGAGKTSLTEAILHKTGATNRLGSVDDKTSICDYYDEEKVHGHSIKSSVAHTQYGGKQINIIDTPGYPDFIGPSVKAIAGAETVVIVVNAMSGVETVTRKVFETATKTGKTKLIVINKMDAENAELPRLIKDLQECFGMQCRCANLPSADRASVIDCIENSTGSSPVMDVAQAHTELIETIIEVDDKLMESYLGGEQIPPEKVSEVFVHALMAGTVVPIVFTNARKEIGVEGLLNIIAKYTPSPLQAQPTQLKAGDKVTMLQPDPAGPLAGLVFRVSFDPRSNMKFSSIRIFSGTIKSDMNMIRNDEKKGVRPGHVLKSQGGETQEIPLGLAGDIITLAKIEDLRSRRPGSRWPRRGEIRFARGP